MENFIKITAVDTNSSDTMSRSFTVHNEHLLKAMITEWEKEIPYRKYQLVTDDFIDEYTDEVQEILDQLEITN